MTKESVYERLDRYRKEGLEQHKKDIKNFMKAIKKGKYPLKCLECYKIGIAWCRFWNKNFECEEFEKELIAEKIEVML